MKRFAACLVALVCVAGCQNTNSSKSSFNLLAPYGSSRVAPPSTNSVGANGEYYNRTANPTVTVPTIRKDGASAGASISRLEPAPKLATGSWKRLGDPSPADTAPVGTGVVGATPSQISPVAYTSPSAPAGVRDPTTTSSLLQLTGMSPNDASNLPEPPRFQPSTGAVPLTTIGSPQAASAPNMGVATAQASDNVVSRGQGSAESSSSSTLNWRDRYDTP